MLAGESLWDDGAALPLLRKACWLASRLERAVFGRVQVGRCEIRQGVALRVCEAEFWRIGMENGIVPAATV